MDTRPLARPQIPSLQSKRSAEEPSMFGIDYLRCANNPLQKLHDTPIHRLLATIG